MPGIPRVQGGCLGGGEPVVQAVEVPCPPEKVVLECPAFPEFKGKLSRHAVKSKVEDAKLANACKAKTIFLWNSEWDRCNKNDK